MLDLNTSVELSEYCNSIQINHFLATPSLINQTAGKYLSVPEYWEKEDISQEVLLSLLIWKRNRPRENYSLTEWLKIARTATRNEINDFYLKKLPRQISLSEIDEEYLCHHAKRKNLVTQLEGNTTMELHLLASRMWEVIKTQSFFENCILLLKNEELTATLLGYRGCRRSEMATRLQLTELELSVIIERLPLSDQEIAEILADRFDVKATPTAIRKARQRATDHMHAEIYGNKPKPTTNNDQPSEYGKT